MKNFGLGAIVVGSLFVEQALCATVKRSTAQNPTSGAVLLATADGVPPKCFPALGFEMPNAPPASLTNWWCNYDTEYAFVGFGYDVSACPNATQLEKDFSDMRNTFNGRYVRLYDACDNEGFYDDVIEAAWAAGIGVHALIWFGYTGGNEWETRRDTLLNTLHSNPKAKFVTRVVQFGSEPLFDNVLASPVLAAQVTAATKNLSSLGIPVTISELAYGWQEFESEGSLQIMNAIGPIINVHMLPFYSVHASIANQSWPLVLSDINWFLAHDKKKKIYLDENGWPSGTSPGAEPSTPSAVANVQNERDYFTLLDENCRYFKNAPNGGIGWFAHIYADQQVPGFGIYDLNGTLKFHFKPQTSC